MQHAKKTITVSPVWTQPPHVVIATFKDKQVHILLVYVGLFALKGSLGFLHSLTISYEFKFKIPMIQSNPGLCFNTKTKATQNHEDFK